MSNPLRHHGAAPLPIATTALPLIRVTVAQAREALAAYPTSNPEAEAILDQVRLINARLDAIEARQAGPLAQRRPEDRADYEADSRRVMILLRQLGLYRVEELDPEAAK